jgi:hypothetical protein
MAMEVIKFVLENPNTVGVVIALLWVGYMTKQVKRLQDRLDFVQDRQFENREALQRVGLLHRTDLKDDDP